MADKAYIDSMIKNNDEKAQYYANKTLRKVRKSGAHRKNPLKREEKSLPQSCLKIGYAKIS